MKFLRRNAETQRTQRGAEAGFSLNTFREFTAAHKTNERWTPTAFLQSQRDCVLQPKVARNELPWVAKQSWFNPNGAAATSLGFAATPLGLWFTATVSQGSSCLATLGYEPESLWDSTVEFPKGIHFSDEAQNVSLRYELTGRCQLATSACKKVFTLCAPLRSLRLCVSSCSP